MSSAIANSLITLKEASEPLDNGQQYPLFLLCLQHLHKSIGQTLLSQRFNESKMNLIQMLPENDRSKERLGDILEDRNLSFLYPMLKVESELWKQLNSNDCTPTSLYRWIKENVDASLQNSAEFIQVLFMCLLKYFDRQTNQQVTSETTTQQNGFNNGDHEKEQITKYQQVLKAFLHDKPSLQLTALYALQTYFYHLGFPKGNLIVYLFCIGNNGFNYQY